MAIYKIQAPDGKLLTIEGPDGAGEAEVIARAQTLYQPQPAQVNNLDDVLAAEQNRQSLSGVPAAPLAAPQSTLVSSPLPTLPAAADAFAAPNPMKYPPVNSIAEQESLLRSQIQGPPQPEAGYGEIFTKGVENAPTSTVGALAGVGRAIVESTSPQAVQVAMAGGPLKMIKPLALSLPSLAINALMDNPAETLATVQNEAMAQTAENQPNINPDSTMKQIVSSTAQSLPQQIPGLAASVVTRNPEFSLGSGMAVSGGQEYGEQRAAGRTPEQSFAPAVINAVAERMGEKLPLGEILDKPAKAGVSGVAGKVVRTASKDSLGETFTQGIQDEVSSRTTNPEMTIADRLRNQVVAAGAGALGSSVMTTPIAAVESYKAGKAARVPEAPPAPRPDIPLETPDPQAPATPIGETTPAPTAPEPVRPGGAVVEQPEQPTAPPAKATEPQPAGASAQPEESKAPARQAKKVVTPDGSIEIDTQEEVVDADQLTSAGEDLQPRDRTKATSDIQIQKIANELDPERLGESRTTDQGAPIVGPDNVVESGNGRTAAIRQAYAANGESAAKYRASLVAKGYNIDGIKNPVLIRRRTSEFTLEQRVKFTTLSNKSQIAEMSSTEKARADAGQISDDILDLYKSGEPDSADNVDFIRSFMGKVVTGNETGALIGRDNRPTQEGVKRAKAALVAKAYDDPDLVENIFDSADPEVKSIGNVLRDRAPEYAQLGADVRRGNVPKRFDIAKQLMKAVKTIRDAKRDGKPIEGVIEGTNQTSLIDETERDPLVAQLVRQMYRPGYGRMLSQAALDKMLSQYANQAREQREQDLFGENKTTPAELLDSAYKSVTADMETKAQGQNSLGFADETDSSLEDSRRVPRSGYARSKNPDDLAATSGRDFSGFSKNDGLNVLKNVFADSGINPEDAVNMPPQKQLQIVKSAVEKKFGMRVSVAPNVSIKSAIDQLADMYVGIQFMANIMNMAPGAIGLNNTLSLQIEKDGKPYLGVYNPSSKTIGLPGKSNSFSHEWLHAFDHFLSNQFGGSFGQLFSGAVREGSVQSSAGRVQKSVVNLMNALFFDKSFLAAQVLDLEHKLLHSKSQNVKSDAERKLKQIENGNYKGINGRTDYYKGSRTFATNADYWTKPEEMMARAYEAYAAHKIDLAGGTTAGVSKENVGYLTNADDRLAKTFPKATERMRIFDAFDELFNSVNAHELVGPHTGAEALPDIGMAVLSPTAWDKWVPLNSEGKSFASRAWEHERKAFNDFFKNRKIVKAASAEAKKLGITGNDTTIDGLIAFQKSAFRAMRAVLHGYEKKSSSTSLKEANDRLLTRPGQSDAVSAVFSEELGQITSKHHNRIRNVIKNYGIEKWLDADFDKLRDVLQSRNDGNASKEVVGAAAGFRSIYDSLFKAAESAGIELGYLRDAGYTPRYYKEDLIIAKPDEFLDKASEVYGLQFDKMFGDAEAIASNLDAFIETLNDLKSSSAQNLPLSKKEINKIISDLSNAEKSKEAIDNIVENYLDKIRAAYSYAAAEDWLTRIQDGPNEDIEANSPYSGFTKKRTLPPETDVILKEFLETDMLHVIRSYTDKMAAKISHHNVMTPQRGPTMANLYKKMLKEGLTKKDVDLIKAYHESIIGGKPRGTVGKTVNPLLSAAYTFGTVMLLPRAVFSSIAEPVTTAMRTGRLKDAGRYYLHTLEQLAGTENAKFYRDASRYIGVVTEDMVDMSIDARLGGGLEIGLSSRATLSGFFRKTLLTPLTNQQRTALTRVSYQYIGELGRTLIDPKTDEKTKGAIKRDLAEYGIPPDEAESFAKWVQERDGKPTVEDLELPYGKVFRTAVWRFNKQMIQDPKREDKPYFASTQAGATIYAVTSFAFSYWENVTKALGRKIKTTREIDGNYEAVKVTGNIVAGFAALYAVTFIVQAARLALFDAEKWKQLDDEDKLRDHLLQRSLDYTGITGPILSFLNNAATGVRYQRDLATSLSGAHLGSFFDWMQKMWALGLTNSEKTNTAEYNALKSTFRTIIAPTIAIALANAPGGSIIGTATGAAIMSISSNTAADNFAEMFVGPKGGKDGKSPSEPKEPKEPKEPREK